MAYTSVIPVHRLDCAINYVLDDEKCSRKKEKSLEGEIGKALNQDQTEQGLFESALGCTCETAFEDMCRIKKMWHKEGGVQGFHLVQSFAAGEVAPELAHQIGLEFARQLLGEEFQAVVSTHLNTRCTHNHIVWNSVSMKDGRKYRSNQKSYLTQVRRISDKLCRKYGLSVIQTKKSERVGCPYAQWLAEQNGMPTWKTAIQQDVNAAIASSLTWKQFLRMLEKQGYTFRFDRKYPTLKPPGKEHCVRFKTLGRNYTPEAIQNRILYPKPYYRAGKEAQVSQSLLPLLEKTRSCKRSGLQALYFSYLYKVGALPKKPQYLSYAVREDIRKLDKRIEQAEFIFQNQIETRDQLTSIRQKAENEIAALLNERRKLYRYDPDSQKIDVLTGKLKELRHTVKLCRNIETHCVEMEQQLQAARLEEQQQANRKTKTHREKER